MTRISSIHNFLSWQHSIWGFYWAHGIYSLLRTRAKQDITKSQPLVVEPSSYWDSAHDMTSISSTAGGQCNISRCLKMWGQRGCPETSVKTKGSPKNCPCAFLEDLLASELNHYGWGPRKEFKHEKISNLNETAIEWNELPAWGWRCLSTRVLYCLWSLVPKMRSSVKVLSTEPLSQKKLVQGQLVCWSIYLSSTGGNLDIVGSSPSTILS
jgi:hypothetical protein